MGNKGPRSPSYYCMRVSYLKKIHPPFACQLTNAVYQLWCLNGYYGYFPFSNSGIQQSPTIHSSPLGSMLFSYANHKKIPTVPGHNGVCSESWVGHANVNGTFILKQATEKNLNTNFWVNLIWCNESQKKFKGIILNPVQNPNCHWQQVC